MSKSTQQKPVKRIVVLCDHKSHALNRGQVEWHGNRSLVIDNSKATISFEVEDHVREHWFVTVIQEMRGITFHEYIDWRDDFLLDFVKMRITSFQPNLLLGDWKSE